MSEPQEPEGNEIEEPEGNESEESEGEKKAKRTRDSFAGRARRAFKRRVVELQAIETEVERKKGEAELDHKAIDARVYAHLKTEIQANPLWLDVLISDGVSQARGTYRQSEGPQLTKGADDQLRMLIQTDALLRIDEDHSQYLGVLEKQKDAPRLGKAARALEDRRDAKEREARNEGLKARGVRDVQDNVINDQPTEYDPPRKPKEGEEEGSESESG